MLKFGRFRGRKRQHAALVDNNRERLYRYIFKTQSISNNNNISLQTYSCTRVYTIRDNEGSAAQGGRPAEDPWRPRAVRPLGSPVGGGSVSTQQRRSLQTLWKGLQHVAGPCRHAVCMCVCASI